MEPISEQLLKRFSFHPATTEARQQTHTDVRREALALASLWELTIPASDERDKAIDAIELAMFYANAAVARHGDVA